VVFALHTLPVRSIEKSEFDGPERWLRTNRLKRVARVASTSAPSGAYSISGVAIAVMSLHNPGEVWAMELQTSRLDQISFCQSASLAVAPGL